MIEVAHPDRWATSILEGFVTVYLGTLGRMIPIYSTPSAQLETEERYSFRPTLEGRRKAQARPIGRRTWGLNAQFADPREHSLLAQFASGAWGAGPFVFVPADAPHTNLLTPAVASLDPSEVTGTQGGPVQLPDGSWAPRTVLGDGVGNVLFGSTRSPVPPSGPVSAGAWVQGAGASVRLNWYDSSGAFVGSAISTVTSSSGWVWSTISATPPAGAAGVIVSANKSSRATRPTLVWGSSTPSGWSDGQGCAKAVVSAMSRDQVLAVRGNTFSNVSFTVTEVG